mmetsp:Transcript_24974/g.34739  ORF Transcript_24974/g.34739 Transcript_24974/m.34739 type:complete len:288 (+) Transcript_24974:145-1008(+)
MEFTFEECIDAIEKKNYAKFQVMLRSGNSLLGLSPMMIAALHQHGAWALYLQKASAAKWVNERSTEPLSKLMDQLGMHIDADLGKDTGYTPLMLAMLLGSAETVAALLEFGANVDLETKNGFTAIFLAEIRGDKGLIEMLKKHQSLVKSETKSEVNKTSSVLPPFSMKSKKGVEFTPASLKHSEFMEEEVLLRMMEGESKAQSAHFTGTLPSNVFEWEPCHVDLWAREECKLNDRVLRVLKHHELDGTMLLDYREDMMKEDGMEIRGDRVRLSRAISKLKAGLASRS